MRKGQTISADQREKRRAAQQAAWAKPEVREKLRAGMERATAAGHGPGRPKGRSQDEVLCEACREGNCNACDGGDCRCVCALELDWKIVRRGSRAA